MLSRIVPLALLLATFAPSVAHAAPALEGTWRNAADTVRIRVARCGRGMCGTVISASDKAREDAARGGTERLVGTQLFHDFREEEDGLWYGEVYVPDLARSFDGTIELQGRDTLVGTGCLFGSLGCRSQTWTRVNNARATRRR